MKDTIISSLTPVMYKIAKIVGNIGDIPNKFYGNTEKCLPPIENTILILPAFELAARIRTRELSSEQVLRAFIDRINVVNPLLNAIVDERFLAAIEDAKDVDHFLKHTDLTVEQLAVEKPLLGLPFTVKDSIQVNGMAWTSGCYRRKGIVSNEDAPVVANYRKAGAIPIALSNVPELLLWFASSNKLHGSTNNPFDLSRVPGGSSGGEAAIVAACGSPLSICSDIGGSIRMPAFHCGLFGHKPTHKIIDFHGTFPPIQDGLEEMFSFGPIAKHVDDLIPSLRVMAGKNFHMFNKIEEPVDLRTIKVFYMEESGIDMTTNTEQYIKDAIIKSAFHLCEKYQVKVEKAKLEHFKHISKWYMVLFSNNQEVSELITENTGKINPFAELAKYVFGFSDYSVSALSVAAAQATSKMAYDKKTSPEVFEQVKQTLVQARDEFNSLLGDNGVFIYVTLPRTALKHYASAFEFGNVCCPMVMNYLNVPSTQVPTGLHEGLPFGIQVAASAYNDRLSIAVAKELEQLFGGWINPSDVLQ